MLSLTIYSPMLSIYEKGINWNIPKPNRLDYLCDKCKISKKYNKLICNIPMMCAESWKQYQKDVSKYLILKYKDTYIRKK